MATSYGQITLSKLDEATQVKLVASADEFISYDFANGVSVTGVTNYYLASAEERDVTTETSGWTTSTQAISSSKPYLWNYDVVTWSNGTNSVSTYPMIIARYDHEGGSSAVSSIQTYYQAYLSNSIPPTEWSNAVVYTTNKNKYEWKYERVTYADSSIEDTQARVIGTHITIGTDTLTSATYEPSSITITSEFSGSCEFGKWQYSYDGITWADVLASMSTGGISFNEGTLTVQCNSEYFTEGNTYIVFKCISADGNHSDTASVKRTVEPTTIFKEAFSEIKQADDKIALIATDEELQTLGEHSTLASQVATLEVEAGEISLEVAKKVNGDEIISSINVSGEEIQIKAEKIELDGYVQFEDLSASYPEWDSQETYSNGARVSYGGNNWTSTMDNNTNTPGNEGWINGTLINGANIITGSISASQIHGGELSLGGSVDNVNGVAKVYDANGNLAGQWDVDGAMYRNTSSGEYVRLGGENTGLTGYDSEGNEIFWVESEEFNMTKAVIRDEITIGSVMRFIPIKVGTTNDGIGIVSVPDTE